MSAGTGTATKKMMVHLDVDQNQIKNLVLHNLASDPTGVRGQIYYNTSLGVVKFHNGSQWITLDTGGGQANIIEGISYGVNTNTMTALTLDNKIAKFKFANGTGTTASASWDSTNKNLALSWSLKYNTTHFTINASNELEANAIPWSCISGAPTGMMIFKGSVGSGGTIEWSALPTAASSNNGWTYKVITDHSSAPICKSGDTIVSNGSSWVIIPSGDEPSGTVTSVGLLMPYEFEVSNSPITTSGTLSVSRKTGYDNPVYSFTYINASAITPVSDIATITLNNGSTFVETLPTGKMPDYNRATFEVYEKVTESDVDYWDKIECAIRVTYDDSPSQIATFRFNTSSNIAASSIKITINAPLMDNQQ